MVDAGHHNLATSLPDLLSTQMAASNGLFFSQMESLGEEVSEDLRELSVDGADDGLDEDEELLEESTMMKASPASPQQESRWRSTLRIRGKSLATLSRPKTTRKRNPWPEERSELREMSTLCAPV